MSFYKLVFSIILIFSFIPANLSAETKHVLNVTVMAYNSRPSKSGKPSITAWGDKLVHGMKAIAVSRDLIKMGLTHGTEVKIEGLPGTYKVMDKMGRRWRRLMYSR